MIPRSIVFRSLAPSTRSVSYRPAKMPLRAKIQSSAFSTSRTMASQENNDIPKEQPDDTPDDVLFNTIYGVRTIELNRPKKLNSLDGSMCRKIIPRLMEWEKSDMINAVIMKGAGEKALCAGGDVAALAKWNQEGPEGRQRSKDYFALEYKLDHLIATYSKPYVSFMDGITMGGGVGLSAHAPFKIATERTVFAMPETDIGFFPEVGASFFLPRLDGQTGKYLALTSERLKGVQVLYAGIASHYIHSSSLPDLEQRLAELTIPDYASLQERCKIINSAINEFSTALPYNEPIQLSGALRRHIDKCFEPDKVEDILHNLDSCTTDPSVPDHVSKWAKKTAETMKARSPTSLKVTCKQMLYGKQWNIAQAFDREHRIASHFMEHHDFTEGVSAKLIRKPAEKPRWQPSNISEVSEQDADAFFRTAEGDAPPLRLLKQGPGTDYLEYPHAWLCLPSEKSILDYVSTHGKSEAETVAYFVGLQDGKLGVREKVEEVLARAGS